MSTHSLITVDGALFHSCLQSIPLNPSAALDLLDALEPYVELQSTLDYLSNPPDDWPHSPIDIKASLRSLAEDVVSGRHVSEYTFQTALYNLFLSAHDAHFSFIPDLFGVGSFRIPGASLISVSPDPNPDSDSSEQNKLPAEIYFVSDVLEIIVDDNANPTLAWIDADRLTYTPSPITSINGMPVSDFLSVRLDQSGTIPFHDRHAAYNHLFFEISQLTDIDLSTKQGAFPNPVFYPGPETVFGFENGTTVRIQTIAEVHLDFDRVHDGRSAYEKFCDRSADNASGAPHVGKDKVSNTPHTLKEDEHEHEHEKEMSEPEFVMTLPFYPPTPIVTDSQGRMTGYFLDVEDDFLNDTAVLVILDFSVNDDDDDAAGFQHTLAKFLDTCKSKGKTKLIIDLFGDGGGTLELGVDTARRIFPDMEYEVHGNMRTSDVLRDLGAGYNSHTLTHATNAESIGGGSLFDIRSLLDIHGQAWESWDGFYDERPRSNLSEECGGQRQRQGQLTVPFKINCAVTAPPGLDLQGRMPYSQEGDSVVAEPVFGSENVVILTDGFCASTCAVFVELLSSTRTSGVKSVVVGGMTPEYMSSTQGYARRGPDGQGVGKMQVVGTTKGAAFWRFSEILDIAQSAIGGSGSSPDEPGDHDHASERQYDQLSFGDADLKRQAREHEHEREQAFREMSRRLSRFTDLPLRRTKSPHTAGVNGVNHLRYTRSQEDEMRSRTPLQFVSREADLRIFPTKETVVDKRALWRRVRELVFGE